MEPTALATLLDTRIIAVIRAPAPQLAIDAALAVAAGGVPLIEITFTVPEATGVMRALAGRADLVVGCGTARTADQARAALDAGARFVVAPNLSPDVAKVAVGANVLYVPGAYTTTEIVAARDAGAHVVKVYPVGVAGGPDYIRVIRDPLPDIPMLAAGGTTLENLTPFLEAGCVAVGLGASLADPRLAAAGAFDEITARARAFAERARAFRRSPAIAAQATAGSAEVRAPS